MDPVNIPEWQHVVDPYNTPLKDCYLPAHGQYFKPSTAPFVQLTDWTSVNSAVDYTGTVLGYYAGYADIITDTWVYPGAASALWDMQHLTEAIDWGTAAECLFQNPLACFSGILAVLSEEVLKDIPVVPTTKILDNRTAGLMHFHNRTPRDRRLVGANLQFDHVDGYCYDQDYDHTVNTYPGHLLAEAFDFHVHYDLSKNVIQSYNIQSPGWPGYVQQSQGGFTIGPDGHEGTKYLTDDRTTKDYWESTNPLGDSVFMPVDNLGFANWNHWLNVRQTLEPGGTPWMAKNLIGLGLAMHALQDATSAPHIRGSLDGAHHSEYEDHIEAYFDVPTMKRDNCETVPNSNVAIMNWNAPDTIQDIMTILLEVVKPEILSGLQQAPDVANRNDIPLRRIIRRLSDEVLNKHSSLPIVKPWDGASAMAKTIHARFAIKYAVAGTVALLIHGAKSNIVPVKTVPLGPPTDFDGDGVDNVDDRCPTVADEHVGSDGCAIESEEGKTSFGLKRSSYLECYTARIEPFAEQWDEQHEPWNYAAGVFESRAFCEVNVLGETRGTVAQRTSAKMGTFQALRDWVLTGDRLQFARDMACVRQAHPAVYPGAPATDGDLCACTLDTDLDGVSDCADTCTDTPTGATVDAKGCAQPT